MNHSKISRWSVGFILSFVTLVAWGQKESELDNFNMEFEQFIQGQQSSFDVFIEQRDREFLQMLQDNWQEFERMAPLVRDPEPKFIKAPTYLGVENKQVEVVDKSVVDEVTISEVFTPELSELKPSVMMFYGNKLQLPSPHHIVLDSIDEQGVSLFWQQSLRTKYSQTINELTNYKTALALSDWAYWLLVKQYSDLNYENRSNSLAFSWFLLLKSGYKVRLAIKNDELVLLMSTDQKLYGIPFYTLSGERHYQLSGKDKGSIKTYLGDYSSENSALDLSFTKTLKTVPILRYRHIKYEVDGGSYSLKFPYDYQRVRYFSTYPQIELQYYFQAPVGDIAKNGLLANIPPLLNGDNDHKINQLLRFIHVTFPYAVDDVQFGKENYLMLEETLHYQASDCEDRSVLLAWLIRKLLNEKVVALYYPGHVTSAIERDGDIFPADPTYIGSKLGDVIPAYRKINAEVMRF